MTPIRTLETAEDDLLRAADRLEGARRGWGEHLIAEYHTAVETIGRFPRLFPAVDDPIPGREFRNAILEWLHYRIIYEVRPGGVVIAAVAHTRRRPGSWHRQATAD